MLKWFLSVISEYYFLNHLWNKNWYMAKILIKRICAGVCVCVCAPCPFRAPLVCQTRKPKKEEILIWLLCNIWAASSRSLSLSIGLMLANVGGMYLTVSDKHIHKAPPFRDSVCGPGIKIFQKCERDILFGLICLRISVQIDINSTESALVPIVMWPSLYAAREGSVAVQPQQQQQLIWHANVYALRLKLLCKSLYTMSDVRKKENAFWKCHHPLPSHRLTCRMTHGDLSESNSFMSNGDWLWARFFFFFWFLGSQTNWKISSILCG